MKRSRQNTPVDPVNQDNRHLKNTSLTKKYGQESPQRKRINDHYLNEGAPIRTEENKNVNYELSPSKKDQQVNEAMKVLDMHITMINKSCYYFLKGEVVSRNDNVISMLRDFNHHEDSDLIVRNCQRFANETGYAKNLKASGRSSGRLEKLKP
jgi:hypothetical protein